MKKNSPEFFEKHGYAIIKFFSKKDIKNFLDKVNLKLYSLIKKRLFNDLKNYHKVSLTKEEHTILVNPHTRFIDFDRTIIKKIKSNKILKNILNYYWENENFNIKWGSSTLNYKTIPNASGYRIARPISTNNKDVAGVHIDLHFGGKIRTNNKAMLTFWTPLTGFSNKYTLRIAPYSHKHYWPVSSISKQKKYITPVFKKNYKFPYKFYRPNLKIGEVLIFHPNLLHGGSLNNGKNTRVSLDFRIFNTKALNN